MKKILTLCLFGIALIFLSLVGCKVRIIVPEGGDVVTESGSYKCLSGETCDIDIADFFFDETFIAQPSGGYKFKFWKKGPGRLCGWNNEPCRVYTAGLEEKPELAEVILSFLESDEIFYLQPVFEPPTDADVWAAVYDYGYYFIYCDRKGHIGYDIGIRNLGPAVAKDVVVNIEEELFRVTGWSRSDWPPGGCTSRLGVISCPIGDLEVASQENNWTPTYHLILRSDYFRNTKKREHRVKLTVSSGSEDPDLSNNTDYWTTTIPPFPKNQGLCDYNKLLGRF